MNTHTFRNILPVLRYSYQLVWKYEKAYFLVIISSMLISGFSPFINILLPKYIIDELLGNMQLQVIVLYIAALVLLNLVVSAVNNIIKYYSDLFQQRMDLKCSELLGEKVMSMDYENLEKPEILTKLSYARDGMGWYSGGIGGLSTTLISLVSSIITFIGTVYIVGKLSPYLLLVLIVIIAANTLVVSRVKKEGSELVFRLTSIRRPFYYYAGMLKDFSYGKDIRIYNASNLISDRTDKYIREDWGRS